MAVRPLIYWIILLLAGSLPLLWAARRASVDTVHTKGRFLLWIYPCLLLVTAAVAALHYFRAIQPYVGDVDFFYYLCYAREMLRDPSNVNPGAYSYFPGVYAFWRGAMIFFGEELATLQCIHLVVVAIAGGLIAVLVYRTTDHWIPALASCFFYWVWASRFEGFAGVTEPLATLPFLLGLVVLGGQPMQGAAGRTRAIACGIAWGLCVYTKQQAGLLTVGYLALIAGKFFYPKMDGWRQLLGIPLVAFATLVIAIHLEGRDWQPLIKGLSTASQYEPEGSLLQNLYVQLRQDESAALAAIVSLVALALLSVHYRRRGEWPPWLRLLQIAAVGATFSLLQFQRRAYGHYLLLALPSLTVVYVTVAWRFGALIYRRYDCSPLAAWLCAAIAMFPLFYTGGNPTNFHVWQVTKPDLSSLRLWHQQREVLRDLRYLASVLKRESRPHVFVLPPYRNDVYFLIDLQATPSLGHGYQLPDVFNFPWNDVDVFIVVNEQFDDHAERAQYRTKMRPILESLQKKGFRLKYNLRAMKAYSRPADVQRDRRVGGREAGNADPNRRGEANAVSVSRWPPSDGRCACKKG